MKNLSSLQAIETVNWEQHFINESQLLQDKLAHGELQPEPSRLKQALESNILEWLKYSHWAQENYLAPILKRGLFKDQLAELARRISVCQMNFADFKLEESFLLPLEQWQGQLIVLGLEPHAKLTKLQIPIIFILCPPEIITTIISLLPVKNSKKQDSIPPVPLNNVSDDELKIAPVLAVEIKKPVEEFDLSALQSEIEDSLSGAGEDNPDTPLDLPQLDKLLTAVSEKVSFGELLVTTTQNDKKSVKETTASTAPQAKIESTNNVLNFWKSIDDSHDSSSEVARKNFDGFAVLKINNNKTLLHRLDDELKSEKIDLNVFSFNLDEINPLSSAIKSKKTESISLASLKKNILDFKFVCITPLFLGDKPVGFLLGFKTSALNQQDEMALSNLTASLIKVS